jgi:hypothetical protein
MSAPRKNHDPPAQGRVVFWLLAGLAVSPPPGHADDSTNLPPLAVWDTVVRVTAGGGYRDNVLLTSVAPESSSFFMASADAFVSRLSESGSQFTAFALGEETHYFDAPSVDNEQLVSANAQYTTPLGAREEVGAELQYLYQNAVLDVSETEVTLRRLLVKGHGFTLQPTWTHELEPDLDVKLEATALRQIYHTEDLDDFWEAAGRFSLVNSYGNKSDISLGYRSLHRFYDTRNQYDATGKHIPDTSLVYWQQEVGCQWRHYWDRGRHWRTTTKAGPMFSRDNGSGYFDYDRFQLSEQLRWGNDRWDIKAQARCGWYLYDMQRIGNYRRQRSYYEVDFRVERRLGKYLLLYAAARREWNMSNDPLEEYNDWIASAGLGTEF